MTLEQGGQLIPETELPDKFLACLLGSKDLSLPAWKKLPYNFDLPANWTEVILQLAETAISKGRETRVMGYLLPNQFQPQDLRFGELSLSDELSLV